ncbi:MAG: hypothetical protein L0Z62_12520 [Gemmataceae bacterium]|nr:hypothetical protein [Gemmataceae bacterium]
MPVQVLNKTSRDEIFRRTLEAVQHPALTGQCLEFAWRGYRIIKGWPGAPRTIIQARSAQWPRIPPEMDDGVRPTHFAYEWHADSHAAQLLRSGIVPVVRRADNLVAASLPEMHVWLACPDSGELVDFTTGHWPAACLATLGEDWPGPRPPEYLWTFGNRLPAGVNYLPDREAIDVAILILRQQGRDYP